MSMLYVITYDIPDDRRRLRVANYLEGYGSRVQKSVFEVYLEPADYARLRGRLERLVKANEDSLRIYRLCSGCRQAVEAIGKATTTEEPGLLII